MRVINRPIMASTDRNWFVLSGFPQREENIQRMQNTSKQVYMYMKVLKIGGNC